MSFMFGVVFAKELWPLLFKREWQLEE